MIAQDRTAAVTKQSPNKSSMTARNWRLDTGWFDNERAQSARSGRSLSPATDGQLSFWLARRFGRIWELDWGCFFALWM